MTFHDLGLAMLWIAVVVGAANAAAMGVILKRLAVAWFWDWQVRRLIARRHAAVNQPLIQLIKSEHQRH